MAEQKKTILIVDDQPVDCAMIQIAVESCLQVLGKGSQFDIKLASNPKDAIAIARTRPAPALIITDLFMPEADLMKDGEFSSLTLSNQCDEMEFPHGIEMLTQLKNLDNVPKLVTTFFWNYPGFSRYTDCIYRTQHGLADGTLPKDIFFLVAGLSIDHTNQEVNQYSPLRILVQALAILLSTARRDAQSNSVHFRSLFEESSDWLTTFPHHVLNLRNATSLVGKHDAITGGGATRKGERAAYKPWDTYDEIISHGSAGPWMPRFVIHSAIGGLPSSRGIYQRIMNEIEASDWKMEIDIPAVHTPLQESSIPTRREFTLNGETFEVKYPSRAFGFPSFGFLNPRSRAGAEHRRWAQLLVTLGFFSYWCHLPDHRAVRTAEEIGEIITARAGKPYGGLETPTDRISEDIELLEILILKKLRSERHNDWWRYFIRNPGAHVIGSKRLLSRQVGYWLNASLVLHRK